MPLTQKLHLLHSIGRYPKLLSRLFAANNTANIQSLILEATLAFQFETSGKPLHYEVRLRSEDETLVDFHRKIASSKNLYIEMGLVRMPQAVTDLIREQLNKSDYFGTIEGWENDRGETLRLQRKILSKVVSKDGDVVKFASGQPGDYNFVAVEVSELHHGMIDFDDCRLAMYGDSAVPGYARRELFGLFQKVGLEFPGFDKKTATRFAQFGATVHGVLFLRRQPPGKFPNFSLEFALIRNQSLMSEEEELEIGTDLAGAMARWNLDERHI